MTSRTAALAGEFAQASARPSEARRSYKGPQKSPPPKRARCPRLSFLDDAELERVAARGVDQLELIRLPILD